MESLASINFTNEDFDTLQKALSLYAEKNEFISSVFPALSMGKHQGFFGQLPTKWKSADQHDKLILLQAKCVRLKQFLNSPEVAPAEPDGRTATKIQKAPDMHFGFDPASGSMVEGTIVVGSGGLDDLIKFLKNGLKKSQ